MIKGVVFDLDNTLVDSVETIRQAADATLRSKGFRGVDLETLVSVMGLTIFDLFRRVEPAIEEKRMKELFLDYKENYMKFIGSTKLLPKAKETLEALSAKNLKMAVVTTKSRYNAVKVLESFGLAHYFGAVVGFEDTDEHKPSPDPIIKAAGALGLELGSLAVVGDTDADVAAGKAAGAVTIAVTTGVTPIHKILEKEPDYVINNIMEVERIINDLNSRQD